MNDVLGKVHPDLHKFSRFLAAGLFNALAGVLLFVFFFSVLGFHYLLANLLVFVSWAWFGFELQRRWVFRAQASSLAFGKYAINHILSTIFGSILLWFFVEELNTPPILGYLFALGVMTAAIYLSSLFWVFSSNN